MAEAKKKAAPKKRAPKKKNFKDCVSDAVKALIRVKSVDTELVHDIITRVSNLAPEDSRDAARIFMMLDAAERDLLRAKIATIAQEGYTLRYKSGIFDESAIGVEAAAANLRKAIDPKYGNQGAHETGSWTSHRQSVASELTGKLSNVLEYIGDSRYFMVREDSGAALDFLKAVVGIEDATTKSKAMAREFHQVFDGMIDRLINAGVPAEKMKNWFPRSPDMGRIAADMDKFRKWMIDALDPEHHPDAAASAEVYIDTLTRVAAGDATQPIMSFERKMIFKSPQHELEFHLMWGKRSVIGAIQSEIHRRATSVATVEQFGPLGVKMVKERIQDLRADAMKAFGDDSPKTRKVFRELQAGEDLLVLGTQPMHRPENQSWDNWTAATRNFAAAMFLGKTAISQLTEDSVNALIQGRFISGGLIKSFTSSMSALSDLARNRNDVRSLLMEHGMYLHATSVGNVSRLQSAIDPVATVGGIAHGMTASEKARGLSTHAAAITQRITLSHFIENNQRAAAHLRNMRAVARWVTTTDWEKLPASVKKHIFENNGITKAEFNAMKGVSIDAHGVLNGREMAKHFDLNRKYMSMLHREAHIQIIKPDLAASRIQFLGADPNSLGGKALSLMTQFLAWPIAMFRNSLGRDVVGGGVGLAGWVGARIMASMMTIQLYQIVAGRPSYELSSKELWMNSVARSGVLSPAGELILNAFDPNQRQGLPGVVPSTITNIMRSGGAAGVKAIDGEYDKAIARMFRGVKPAVTPNWWQTEWLLNKAFDSIQEELDPEYIRRREKQWEKSGRSID